MSLYYFVSAHRVIYGLDSKVNSVTMLLVRVGWGY